VGTHLTNDTAYIISPWLGTSFLDELSVAAEYFFLKNQHHHEYILNSRAGQELLQYVLFMPSSKILPDMFPWRITTHHPAVATFRRSSKIWFIHTEFTTRASFDEL
jgi:hypothetical protein